MRLLLVDDEEYSREGILSLINAGKPAIDEIRTAENGRDGIAVARDFKPDIILADVKMPKIDGLTMCEEIRAFLPHCSIIIISGYSDKEYLKSAIRLSAVNYLEKPFHPQELMDSLQQAISRCSSHASDEILRQQQHSDIENRIALALLRRHASDDPLWQQIAAFAPDCPANGQWSTLLLAPGNFREPASAGSSVLSAGDMGASPEFSSGLSEEVSALLRRHLPADGSSGFLGIKDGRIFILHLHHEAGLSDSVRVRLLLREISACMTRNHCLYNIGIGAPADSLSEIHHSYETAAVCLQQSFFAGPNRILYPHETPADTVCSFSPDRLDEFSSLLRQGQVNPILEYIHGLTAEIRKRDNTLISSVRDFFAQLVRRLYYFSDSFSITDFTARESLSDSIQTLWNLSYLDELESYLCRKTEELFQEIRNTDALLSENPLPCKIKNYIDASYPDPDLCLRTIADHFNITTSYLCIIFKKQYQKTINQYISAKRIEASIGLLDNSNMKIKDISARVGFQDTNYYIKVFKKSVGITPKEYRRQ